METIERTYEQELVADAGRILDEKCPGWRRFVDASMLNIESVRDCPLAQIGRNMFNMRSDRGQGVWTQMIFWFDLIDTFPYLSGVFADNSFLEAWKELLLTGK